MSITKKLVTLCATGLFLAAVAYTRQRQSSQIAMDDIPRWSEEELSVSPLSAQQALNLTPYRTHIRTENTALSLSSTFVNAFAGTTVTCPSTATNGCTLRIIFSGRYSGATGYDAGYAQATVTGTGSPVDPNPSLPLFPSIPYYPVVATHQWMRRGVPAGASQVVNVQLEASTTGTANDRTLTVEVYTN
jgi:hypothetical protein